MPFGSRIEPQVARKEIVIGFGHPVYTVSDPRNAIIKEIARELDLEAALWLQPAEGSAIVGIGRAWAIEPDGPARQRGSVHGDARANERDWPTAASPS